MSTIVLIAVVVFSLGGVLLLGVMVFSFLKYLKKEYYPHWKFPDYVSVGYLEFLYQRYIVEKGRKPAEEESKSN